MKIIKIIKGYFNRNRIWKKELIKEINDLKALMEQQVNRYADMWWDSQQKVGKLETEKAKIFIELEKLKKEKNNFDKEVQNENS